MKKLFIAVLAVAALASCAQDEVIGNYNRGIIGFSDTFVDNVTKVLYDNSHKVSSFELYGTVDGTGDPVAIYEGVTVEGTKYGEIWDQKDGTVQYWLPECTYNFYAIVDATNINATNGVPTTIEYTATDGLKDLLYGTVTATTDETAVPTAIAGTTGIKTTTDGEKVVAFTLNHLLSKVSFKFTSSVGAPYAFAITDLKLAGAYATGTYTINGKMWEGKGAMTNPLAFSNIAQVVTNTPTAAAESYVIIPGEPVLTITFNAQVSYNGTPVSTIPYTLTVNGTGVKQVFAKNTHYNFSITLPKPGKEIKFTIDKVDGFLTGGDVNVQ